jgi:hypothetical protein
MRRKKRKIVNLKGGLKIDLVVLNFENEWKEKECEKRRWKKRKRIEITCTMFSPLLFISV